MATEKVIYMTGKTIGRWTVLKRSTEKRQGNPALWVCRCTCGKVGVVAGKALRNGTSRSCGCRIKEHHQRVMAAWFPGAEERRLNFKGAK